METNLYRIKSVRLALQNLYIINFSFIPSHMHNDKTPIYYEWGINNFKIHNKEIYNCFLILLSKLNL